MFETTYGKSARVVTATLIPYSSSIFCGRLTTESIGRLSNVQGSSISRRQREFPSSCRTRRFFAPASAVSLTSASRRANAKNLAFRAAHSASILATEPSQVMWPHGTGVPAGGGGSDVSGGGGESGGTGNPSIRQSSLPTLISSHVVTGDASAATLF